MKSKIIILALLLSAVNAYGQKVIFLHHSTGNGVYYEGNVPQWIADYNTLHGTNYEIFEKSYPDYPYPWANYPYDYWNLWINNQCDNDQPNIECMDKIAQDYDVIIFKHCFPGASIEADNGNPLVSSPVQTLANYKLQYRALRALMDSYPGTKFIVWTLAPLHRLATNTADAARAREFADWVKTTWLTEDGHQHPNINIFDFFGYAAESNPTPAHGKLNCLKYIYEGSHSDVDSHPNSLANQTIGPIFAEFIVNTLASQTITVSRSLSAGWSWFSVNVSNADMSIGNVLGSLEPSEGDYIKSQTVSATYYNSTGWFGELTEIDPRAMYKIKLASAGTLNYQGNPVDPLTTPITIKSGWNWIGYLTQSAKSIADALESIIPVTDDYIKNQVASSTFYNGYGWFGELFNLEPLDGYMLKTSHPATLTYPAGEL